MLETSSPAPEATWRPTGHPVRWFVAACTALAVLATAVWWAGLLAPRLATGPDLGRKIDVAAGRAAVFVRLRNDGPLAVRVTGLSLTGVRDEVLDVRVLLPDPEPDTFGEPGAQGSSAFTLEGGQAAEVQLTFPQDECPPGRLLVHARSAIGVARSDELGLDGSDRERRC
jgi:hypothetical protein